MSWKTKLLLWTVAVLVVAGALVYVVLPERFITRVDKGLLEYFGGDCLVEVYSGGQKIRDYQVNGYVLFERQEGTMGDNKGRHDGVITFKDKNGRNVRLGAWGSTILVECK